MTSARNTVGYVTIIAANVIISYKFWPTGRFHIDPFVSRWETVNVAKTRKTLGVFFCLAVDKVKLDVYGNFAKK